MTPDSAIPLGYRVVARARETHDTVTLTLQPLMEPAERRFAPGQFMMLYAHGVGEVAVSVSGDPTPDSDTLVHTIRSVGAVSRALHDAPVGTVIGVRGPFGNGWRMHTRPGGDLVVVTGGHGGLETPEVRLDLRRVVAVLVALALGAVVPLDL